MSDDFTNLNAVAQATTDTLYTVVAGDSLSKLAQRFYGDPQRYPEIAARNNIPGNAIITIGQRLIIPAGTASGTTLPSSPGGSAPVAYDGNVIETVTTTAARIRAKFWEDWRFWGLAAGTIALIWFVNRHSRR